MKTNKKHIVYGVGENDLYRTPMLNRYFYKRWCAILNRCYNKKYISLKPTYKDCEICEEWKIFSVFQKWCEENYVNGYVLDKDILFKGNKMYSPETCCFIPNEINALTTNRKNYRNGIIGVHKTRYGNYQVCCSRYGRLNWLGTYATKEEAFIVYKQQKEAYIKEIAQKYYDDGKINERVYKALLNYKIEIID